jgi:hypothetical protein
MKKILITLIIIACSYTSKAQESKIIGNWQLTTVAGVGETETGLEVVFIFEDTGVLKAARNVDSKTINAGTWKYNKQKKLLVMSSDLDKDFNGEASVIEANNKELIYKKNGATFSFIKLEKMNSPAKIEMEKPILSFESEDFYHSEDGFNEELEAKELPWKITAIVNNLKDKKEILFQYTSFPDSREAASWVVGTKFNFNEADQTLSTRDYSYAQNDYIDMTEQAIPVDVFTENKEDFRFYPEEELDYYKVVATNEILKTALGDFECTVVEGVGGFSEKIQYWMINNQPGIFAKIIKVKDAPEPFGETNVYILKEIK